MVPFATSTEFIASLRAGAGTAAREMSDVDFDRPERVATTIIDLVHSGAARAGLVPVA